MDRDGRRRLMVAFASLIALAAGGCRMDVEVGIDVAGDGSGQVLVAVELDSEATGRITDLADQLRVEDLLAAGWALDGPRRQADGSTTIRASKPFATPEAAQEVFTEISGVDGPFRGFALERRTSFLVTDYAFGGEVDLTAGLEGFGDEELRRRLEGSGVGLGAAELEQLAGAGIEEAFGFEVRASLPGRIAAPTAADTADGVVVWYPAVGERTSVAATSRALHAERLGWLGGSAAAAAALVALGARRLTRRRTRGSTAS
ncbi:MAG: hypothetical protein ACR2K0_05715 [Acidimicrobiales bacterium]